MGTVDLLEAGNDTPTTTNMAQALPDLTSNVEPDYYYLESNTDGDDLITFLQEGYTVTRNGVEETVVSANTSETDAIDWLSTPTAGLTLNGSGGNDMVRVWDFYDNDVGRAYVSGGAGADTFDVAVPNVFGTPQDTIFAQIEDFDPAEDVLMLGSVNPANTNVSEIRVIEHPPGAFSDIEVDFGPMNGADNGADRVAAIRLMGTTGVTADQTMLR